MVVWHTQVDTHTDGGLVRYDRPVDMQQHEGLADPFKLEVHDSWEGSAHQLSRQPTHLQTSRTPPPHPLALCPLLQSLRNHCNRSAKGNSRNAMPTNGYQYTGRNTDGCTNSSSKPAGPGLLAGMHERLLPSLVNSRTVHCKFHHCCTGA